MLREEVHNVIILQLEVPERSNPPKPGVWRASFTRALARSNGTVEGLGTQLPVPYQFAVQPSTGAAGDSLKD